MTGERWAKVPGWRYEASETGLIRSLESGRLNGPSTITATRAGVRLFGSDDDRRERGYFNRASIVWSAFHGGDVRDPVRHKDGDLLNASIGNLEPDPDGHRTRLETDGPPRFLAAVEPAALTVCRETMERAAADPGLLKAGVDAVRDKPRGGDWSVADQCIRLLAEAGLKTGVIAAGLGLTSWKVSRRRADLGLVPPPREAAGLLDGEIWRGVAGYRVKVSNLGRVKGPSGLLIRGSATIAGRPRVTIFPLDGSPHRSVMIASLVLHVFRDCPLQVPPRHLNGDVTDCRLENLEVGQQGFRPTCKRGPKPWTRAQDNALRRAASFAEASRLTGHTESYCRNRMRLLGINLIVAPAMRSGISSTLVERPLENLNRYVTILHGAGVGDETINLGLRILKPQRGQKRQALEAIAVCVRALLLAGCTRQEVGEAIGQHPGSVGEWMVRLGMRERRPDGWRTKAGPIDEREDEEWRQVEGLPQIVSNHGRVATPTGFLLSPVKNNQGRLHVMCTPADGGQRRTRIVHQLVLHAFRPELAGKKVRWLNGDETDNRVENLAPKVTIAPAEAPAAPVRQRGNLAGKALGPVVGSVPRGLPLWAQANVIVPRRFDASTYDHFRDDLLSDIVMLVMEGRAKDVAEAYPIARRERNALTGAWREQSMDRSFGADDGRTLHDVLAEEQEG